MESMDSCPKQKEYVGTIGSTSEMKDYLIKNAGKVVEVFVVLDFPQIPETGYQSSNIVIDMCGKQFKKGSTLESHRNSVHGNVDPESNTKTATKHLSTKSDHVLNYSKVSMTLGLLKLNHDESIHMGDVERIIRLPRVFDLFYKVFDVQNMLMEC